VHPAAGLPAIREGGSGALARKHYRIQRGGHAHGHVLGSRIVAQGGAALIIDYGYTKGSRGDTLQAVRSHHYHEVLDDPGSADLTAHVDFAALGRLGAGGGGVRCMVPWRKGIS